MNRVAQRPHNFIFLTYVDDDGVALSDEDGEVYWQEGRAEGDGIVNYVRINRVMEIFGELRQYVINNRIGMADCSAWTELDALVGETGNQGRLVFAAAKETV